jgi:CheY-like chemotaxis protein
LLPLAVARCAEEEKRPAGPAPSGSETILLVEDEPTVRNLAQTLLQRQGYRVLAARDVEHALTIASNRLEPLDLLLSDVVMPVMSGPDLAIRLTAILPKLKVLFMSGYADHPQLQSGVNGALVTKPFTANALTTAVRSALDTPASARNAS